MDGLRPPDGPNSSQPAVSTELAASSSAEKEGRQCRRLERVGLGVVVVVVVVVLYGSVVRVPVSLSRSSFVEFIHQKSHVNFLTSLRFTAQKKKVSTFDVDVEEPGMGYGKVTR